MSDQGRGYPPSPPGGGYPPGPPPPPAPLSPSDERLWATLAQVGGIFFGFIPSLLIMLILGDRSAFVKSQSREALNFQLTVLIASIVSALLVIVLIGILLLIAVGILDIVLCILAAVANNRGEPYRYPLTLRLVS